MVHILGENNSILNQFISEIRDKNIQNDRLRFRRNFERVGEVIAYEISKTMPFKTLRVETPLGIAKVPNLIHQPVLATILRAGLPLHQGFLNYFDGAENAFISAYRKYEKDGSFKIKFEHLSCPPINGKTLIISDPMLATGASMVLSYNALLEKGTPLHTHIVTIIGSQQGLDYLTDNLPEGKFTVWAGAIDKELTKKSYIVPGLGDAGDLAFGIK
jgi:uracil phosphoribosyltransferase